MELIAQLHDEIETADVSDLPSISASENSAFKFSPAFRPQMRPFASENTCNRLLSANEVAERLGQKPRWVYAHRKRTAVRGPFPAGPSGFVKANQLLYSEAFSQLTMTSDNSYFGFMAKQPRNMALTVTLPEELRNEVEARALSEGRDPSSILTSAISLYLQTPITAAGRSGGYGEGRLHSAGVTSGGLLCGGRRRADGRRSARLPDRR